MKDLSVPAALVIMTLAISLAAFAGGGYQGNHVDLSTKYCALLWGFTNTLSTIPGIFGVSITGYILEASGWWLVFVIAAIIYTTSGIMYILFGQAEQLSFEEEMPVSTQPLAEDKQQLLSTGININSDDSSSVGSIGTPQWRRS